ncbi:MULTISPECIES: hypothetical protein [Pasteurellaceae]|uniref:hypothetical protein n=1 Tax=Pasteurellaceae TaxID=712 RepID=UPI0024912105|nr:MULTISPECIES: hypothetical protein [Pasteurellaceae]
MNILGIRVSPKTIYFSIFDSNEYSFKNVEKISVPQALIIPEQLKYIRNNILDLLREYKVEKAGIKITEGNAQSISIERLYLEGVIQETFASSQIKSYKTLMLSGIASRLNTNARELKKYIENKPNNTGIDMSVSDFNKEEIEAMLVAVAVAQ